MPNLKHLCEPLGGTEGLLETVAFKKTTECVRWRTSPNNKRQWVPCWGGSDCNFNIGQYQLHPTKTHYGIGLYCQVCCLMHGGGLVCLFFFSLYRSC